MNYTLRPELLGDFCGPRCRWWTNISAWRVPLSSKYCCGPCGPEREALMWSGARRPLLSAPDCADAMQYWFQTGVLIPREKASAVSSPGGGTADGVGGKKRSPGGARLPPGSRKRPPIRRPAPAG